MIDHSYEHEFKYLNLEDLEREPLLPCSETPEMALQYGLRDLIKLAEDEGVPEEVVDLVLRRIFDLRAKRVRSKFTIHGPDTP